MFLFALPFFSCLTNQPLAIDEAQQLQKEGKKKEAFLKYEEIKNFQNNDECFAYRKNSENLFEF